jgi:hypothetical protein
MGVGEVTPVAILDRDGTIIDVVRDEETGAISVAFHPSQLRLLSGAVEGLRALQGAGYALAIATNQPAPAKGQFSADAVARTNDALVTTPTGARGATLRWSAPASVASQSRACSAPSSRGWTPTALAHG